MPYAFSNWVASSLVAEVAGMVMPLLIEGGRFSTAFSEALGTVFTPTGVALILGGTILGVTVGSIPGLGGPVALSLLIPVTFELEPQFAFLILAATLGGVNLGGSITAILLNTPGTAPNAATTFDGFPLATQGRGAEAIAASAVASGTGALVGIALFVALLPVLTPLALAFWSPEYFWLALVGIATIAVASRGSVVDDLIAGGVGILLTFHGVSAVTGGIRYTVGTQYLQSGVPLVPAIIGLFAVAQMVELFAAKSTVAEGGSLAGDRWDGIKATVSNWRVVATSSVVGWVVGIVPGVGGTVANFVAYLQAKERSAAPETFGKGNIAGVIASEAANDAKDGGSLVPTLALGIPGSASTAVLLSAFLLHGLTPGPLLIADNLQVVFVVLLALVASNVLTSAIGLFGSGAFVRVTRVPATALVPAVLALAVVGAFAVRGRIEDVALMAGFGVLGYAMWRLEISRVALVIGLVLGGLVEENFQRSLQLSGGEYGVFVSRPLSIALIAVLVFVLAIPVIRRLGEEQS
jgi:putative tricarboxylic transport membrane protein